MKIHWQREIKITHDTMNRRRALKKDPQPRTPGIHISAINQYLGIAAKVLKEDHPFEKITDTTLPLMLALGIGWEEFRASMFQDNELLWQPGELDRDDIYGTPDGILLEWSEDPTGPYPRNWECKRTTKKVCSIEEHWMYQKQAMSYAAMGASRFCQFDILYVLGNYQRPYEPCAMSSLVEFSQYEIDKWWTYVLRDRDKVKAEGGV